MSDNIYYNLTMTNDNANKSLKIAEYREHRNVGILKDTGKYEVACTGFQLPSTNVPLFIFEESEPDFSKGYFITIGNGIIEITEPVDYFPYQNINTNNENTSFTPFKRAIFNYTLFLEQINYALKSLWNNYVGFGQPYNPPFISFDNGLFILNVDSDYPGGWWDGVTGVTEIYFNTALYQFFHFPAQNVDSINLTPKNHKLLFINAMVFDSSIALPTYPLNSVPFPSRPLLQLTQENKTLANWATYKKILFFTQSIPVVKQQIGNQDLSGIQQQFNLITSFLVDGSAVFDKTPFSYDPKILKWISLDDLQELKTIDIKVQLQGKTSTDLIDVYLGPGEIFDFTMMFRRHAKLIRGLTTVMKEAEHSQKRLGY